MIAVDTSALMAVVAREASAPACGAALAAADEILMSAGTLAECLIVAHGRGLREAMALFVENLGPQVIPVDAATAERVSAAYAQWGKGFHRARLNFGDCFSYVTARDADAPLLFVGDDFSRTDIRSVL